MVTSPTNPPIPLDPGEDPSGEASTLESKGEFTFGQLLQDPSLIYAAMEFGDTATEQLARAALAVISKRLAQAGVTDPQVVEYLLWNHPEKIRIQQTQLPPGIGGGFIPREKVPNTGFEEGKSHVLISPQKIDDKGMRPRTQPERTRATAHEMVHAADWIVKKVDNWMPGLGIANTDSGLNFRMNYPESQWGRESLAQWMDNEGAFEITDPRLFQQAILERFQGAVSRLREQKMLEDQKKASGKRPVIKK